MSTPAWMLLAFAAWTLLLLFATVGVYRWSHILTRRAAIASFRSDQLEGAGWYQRATRAHVNCIENLPVFGAIVLALHAGNVTGNAVDSLSIAVVVARIAQSLTHVLFVQSDRVVTVRFSLFSIQFGCFLGLIGIIVARHL